MAKIRVTRIIEWDRGDSFIGDIETDYQDCVIDTDDVLVASPSSRGTYLSYKYNQTSDEITLPFDSYAAIACAGFEHVSTAAQLVS